MLVVRIEERDDNLETDARQIGELMIADDGTGTETFGNFEVAVAFGGDAWGKPGDFKTGRVERHRLSDGPYHLVLLALQSALHGSRVSSSTKSCSRCAKPVRWVSTLGRQRIPVDPEPIAVTLDPRGTIVVVLDDGRIARARRHEPTDMHEPVMARTNHLKLCTATAPAEEEAHGR